MSDERFEYRLRVIKKGRMDYEATFDRTPVFDDDGDHARLWCWVVDGFGFTKRGAIWAARRALVRHVSRPAPVCVHEETFSDGDPS